jgi:hypothetical protein
MRFQIFGTVAILALMSGCGDGREKLVGTAAATGDARVDYATKVKDGINIGKDAAFVQIFCKNISGGPCPETIGDQLKTYGFSSGKSGIDLGYAFAMIAADKKDGSADGKSSDPDFIEGAYRAVFARAADPGGIQTYSELIKSGTIDSRKVMISTILQSPEFKSMK